MPGHGSGRQTDIVGKMKRSNLAVAIDRSRESWAGSNHRPGVVQIGHAARTIECSYRSRLAVQTRLELFA